MRPFALFLCSLVIAPLVWAADPSPEPEETDDAKAILGNWEVAKAVKDGKAPPGGEVKDMKMEITKEQLLITMGGKERKQMAAYKLDVKSKPRGIEITPNGLEDKPIKGIYKLEKGELTMCWGAPGKDRPEKFDDRDKILLVLRKAKAKK